ncbi:AI-2E family transporter [Erythrobacter sp.]|uniref:AI-2E family transporter n=1 Tax=Erythrobacter sp. TaxID=1042 RepID=UPI002EA93659|nr:AI-2E family transporter [Erythrobacter sp.]
MSTIEPHEKSALEHWSFLLLVAIVSILFVWVTWPFVGPVMWAALAAIMFHPLYRWLLVRTRGRRNLSATLSLLTIFVVVLLPAAWIGSIVVEELARLIETLRENPIDIAVWFDAIMQRLPAALRDMAVENGWNNLAQVQDRLEVMLGESAGLIAQEAVAIGSGALEFVLSFGIGLYVLFFLLRDGRRIGDALTHFAPIEHDIAQRLSDRFLGIVRAVIKGSGVVGLVQGSLGGLMLAIAGVPSPLLLGVLMAILALIPAVGTALVWGPAGIWLLIVGDIWQGLFVLGAGLVIISSVDNVLRPILVGRDTGIPDWLILVATLGGISLLGFSGIVVGPLVAGLFLATWSILGEQRAHNEADAARYRTRVDKDGKARGEEEALGDERNGEGTDRAASDAARSDATEAPPRAAAQDA